MARATCALLPRNDRITVLSLAVLEFAPPLLTLPLLPCISSLHVSGWLPLGYRHSRGWQLVGT